MLFKQKEKWSSCSSSREKLGSGMASEIKGGLDGR